MFGANTGPAMGAGFGVFLAVFLIIAAIMSIFIPFWVFRIRNEIIAANKRLESLVKLLTPSAANHNKPAADAPVAAKMLYKSCPECGHQNEIEEKMCTSCRQRM